MEILEFVSLIVVALISGLASITVAIISNNKTINELSNKLTVLENDIKNNRDKLDYIETNVRNMKSNIDKIDSKTNIIEKEIIYMSSNPNKLSLKHIIKSQIKK